MTDEEIEQMQEEIDSEPPPIPTGPDGQPIEQDQEQVSEEDYPPQDNVSDRDMTESETPELDKMVERFSTGINKR